MSKVWTGVKWVSKSSWDHKRITLVVGVVLILAGLWFKPYVFATWVAGTVTTTQGEAGEGNYIIFIEKSLDDIEPLSNKDVSWRFKWNSTLLQGSAVKGRRYRFKVLGRRVPMLSAYRNILKFESVSEDDRNSPAK